MKSVSSVWRVVGTVLLLCPLTFEKYWITRLVSLSVIKQLLNLQLTYWIFFSNVVEHLQCIFFLFFFYSFCLGSKIVRLAAEVQFFPLLWTIVLLFTVTQWVVIHQVFGTVMVQYVSGWYCQWALLRYSFYIRDVLVKLTLLLFLSKSYTYWI